MKAFIVESRFLKCTDWSRSTRHNKDYRSQPRAEKALSDSRSIFSEYRIVKIERTIVKRKA
jgi:hypothetical protein